MYEVQLNTGNKVRKHVELLHSRFDTEAASTGSDDDVDLDMVGPSDLNVGGDSRPQPTNPEQSDNRETVSPL